MRLDMRKCQSKSLAQPVVLIGKLLFDEDIEIMDKDLLNAIITSCVSVIGTLGGVLITLIFQYKTEKRKVNREMVRETYFQYATLCKLEELYIAEIIELRKKDGKVYKEKGIMNEFRNKVYNEGEARITHSEASIKSIAERI